MTQDTSKWTAKYDVYRPTTDFADVMRIVGAHYEMYTKAVQFVGPWVSKQNGNNLPFMIPDKDEIKAAVGKPRSIVNFLSYSSFIEGLHRFLATSKGKKALITPNPTTHHSAQFPAGSFEIKKVEPKPLRDDKAIRKPAKTLHKIEFAGAEEPLFIENLQLDADSIQHVILRPKLGKLGTPSTNRWEVLLYRNKVGYLVEHVDSELNPRWSGIL
jgi:hypothetical protein